MDVRQAVIDAGVFQRGHFVFAHGGHSLVKLEMDALWNNPNALAVVLDAMASYRLPDADVVLGVPTGGQRLCAELVRSGRVDAPMVELVRVPGQDKRVFTCASAEGANLLKAAKSVRIYEDVVTTLSSVAGVVRLLQPDQAAHSLAIWRRGVVLSEFRVGVTDHYLHEEELPVYSQENCPECSKSLLT